MLQRHIVVFMDGGSEPIHLSGVHMAEPFCPWSGKKVRDQGHSVRGQGCYWGLFTHSKECYYLWLSAGGHFGSHQALRDCTARFVVLLIQGLLFKWLMPLGPSSLSGCFLTRKMDYAGNSVSNKISIHLKEFQDFYWDYLAVVFPLRLTEPLRPTCVCYLWAHFWRIEIGSLSFNSKGQNS